MNALRGHSTTEHAFKKKLQRWQSSDCQEKNDYLLSFFKLPIKNLVVVVEVVIGNGVDLSLYQ